MQYCYFLNGFILRAHSSRNDLWDEICNVFLSKENRRKTSGEYKCDEYIDLGPESTWEKKKDHEFFFA